MSVIYCWRTSILWRCPAYMRGVRDCTCRGSHAFLLRTPCPPCNSHQFSRLLLPIKSLPGSSEICVVSSEYSIFSYHYSFLCFFILLLLLFPFFLRGGEESIFATSDGMVLAHQDEISKDYSGTDKRLSSADNRCLYYIGLPTWSLVLWGN